MLSKRKYTRRELEEKVDQLEDMIYALAHANKLTYWNEHGMPLFLSNKEYKKKIDKIIAEIEQSPSCRVKAAYNTFKHELTEFKDKKPTKRAAKKSATPPKKGKK